MGVRKLFDLAGRTALVTGASRGLGLQMAAALGEMGARVVITARKADELGEARVQLAALGLNVIAYPHDLAQLDTIPALVDRILAETGRIDILVNNAGATWAAPAESYPDAAWRKVMDLNVDGLFQLTREVGRRSMIPARAGKIVNIASIAGLLGNPPAMTTIAYNTSKSAVLGFTRALAAEWGKYNINVNAICPGFFPSRMSSGLLQSIGDCVIARTPLQRLGGEEDMMGAVVFLASEASRHVTGQHLAVDGGASIA